MSSYKDVSVHLFLLFCLIHSSLTSNDTRPELIPGILFGSLNSLNWIKEKIDPF